MVLEARTRVALEAVFLIAVAAAAGFLSLSMPAAAAVMAGAWVLVAVTEWRTWRRLPARSASADEVPDPLADPEPLPEPVPPVEPEETPAPDPEGVPPPLPEPLPPAEEPLIDVEPEPEPESAHAPVVLVGAPDPEPEPHEWNIWDLQRAVRASAGEDVERDEERAYLLMYLRDFAGPDGLLPAHFDALVRESFGDLLDSGAR